MVAWDLARESGCPAMRPNFSKQSQGSRTPHGLQVFISREQEVWGGLFIYKKKRSGLWGEGYS